MKNAPLVLRSILVLIVLFILMFGCKVNNNKNDYLRKVLKNLDQIKSATYISIFSTSQPYDTLKYRTLTYFVKEYSDPRDTFVGAKSVHYLSSDTSKMNFYYDGKVSGYLDWMHKTIMIDSFKNNPRPYRVVFAPFYTRTKTIIKYALETKDSIRVEMKDMGDSVQFCLTIYDKVVEFIGNHIVYDSHDGSSIGEISRYDIWIHKSDDLPYRDRRKMLNETSWETCRDVNLNKNNTDVFLATKYFPKDFTLKYRGNGKAIINNLEGKVAPDWILKDADNNTITLNELKSKVLMIQFTGIGCGACHAAIPFLKQLVNDYKDKNFEFISIECWDAKMDGLKKYQDKNSFNFKFLMSTEAVTESYHIQPVPEFLILDKDRVIKKVIIGYSKGATDKEIRDAINKLI
jgi:thiol-disulfide isomerase/thioredoxin